MCVWPPLQIVYECLASPPARPASQKPPPVASAFSLAPAAPSPTAAGFVALPVYTYIQNTHTLIWLYNPWNNAFFNPKLLFTIPKYKCGENTNTNTNTNKHCGIIIFSAFKLLFNARHCSSNDTHGIVHLVTLFILYFPHLDLMINCHYNDSLTFSCS